MTDFEYWNNLKASMRKLGKTTVDEILKKDEEYMVLKAYKEELWQQIQAFELKSKKFNVLMEYAEALESYYAEREAVHYIAGMENYSKIIRYLGILNDELID